MAGKRKIEPSQKPIEQYEHKDKERLNNPPVGLVYARTDNGGQKKKKYQYDPHLDPQLQWAGKAEHTSFEVPTVSLHVHERIDPRRIIETVKLSPAGGGAGGGRQLSLFEGHKKPLRDAIEFYKHKEGWSNRLVAGDSLLVMNSLLEKEGMGGKVQMVYFDPPYGIKYGSNFQPFVNKRDVKDGKDEDLTAEPEMIKAFRDTWELGIHSYLTYLRDRLLLARELLHESGSIFVQISDENVHHVRELMDEVFGVENFVSLISFSTTSGFLTKTLSRAGDYLIWYSKDLAKVKFRQLYKFKVLGKEGSSGYDYVQLPDGSERNITEEELSDLSKLPKGSKVFSKGDLQSQ
ncbi:MAG TPA: DNA methyltransferase [Candidatus Brocadia sapporoensis]|mgnify:CR=1 FL=1|nr:DNA methyltransferase [Candidatus Brocadia sapporoensis]